MQVNEAQAEVRNVYIGGSVGAMVSGAVWMAAAALGTWSTQRLAIQTLVFGGMLIFPLGQMVLLLMGRRATLQPENPFKALAMQIAFTLPLSIPLAGAAALANPHWFFPAMMLIVGVHYIPFITLYGMHEYALFAAALIAPALAIAVWFPDSGLVAAWLTAATEVLFGVVVLVREWNAGNTGAPLRA